MKLAVKLLLGLSVLACSAYAVSIKGLCYSPFHPGESPNGASPTDSEMIQDLVKIKAIMPDTARIRTFGIDTKYLKRIPAIAESLSIRYMVAGWTSFSFSTTWAQARSDLVAFLKTADSLKYTGLEAVMYGYDNTFDGRYTPEADKVTSLKTEIKACRVAVSPYKVKLTHEENWDVWCRHPDLADSLDFVSIRVMPQDDKIAAKDAARYVQQCYDSVKAYFPDKEVKVTSVGWSTVNSCERDQKLFLDSLIAKAAFDYYPFEFADESWKGGNDAGYGLYTVSHQPKLILDSSPRSMDFSKLFSADSQKLDGIVYNYGCFGYATGISLPALNTQIGFWADTFKEISQFTFLKNGDLSAANGQLASTFIANGNAVALFDAASLEPGVKMNFSDIGYNFINGYGAGDSLSRLIFLDNNRHDVAALRQSTGNDSVFIGACLYQFTGDYTDSLLKYPEAIQNYDGLLVKTDLSSLHDKAKIDQYVDSSIANFQTKFPGKKLLIDLDISTLSYHYEQGDDFLSVYLALKKARDKYGFALIFDNIVSFYDNAMTTPSATYKLLMPWRFPAAVGPASLARNGNKAVLCFAGQKAIVGGLEKGASLAIFDLQGRIVKKVLIGPNSSFDAGSAGLSKGTFIFSLKGGDKSLSAKILLE